MTGRLPNGSYRAALLSHAGIGAARCDRCKAPAPSPKVPADLAAKRRARWLSEQRALLGWVEERWTVLGQAQKERLLCRACAIAEGVSFFAEVIGGPPAPPAPTLTPELWRSMRCREQTAARSRCACEQCTWEGRYGKGVAEWQRSQALRPRARSVLPTLDHVLVAWAERTPYRSATGGILARAQDEAQAPERSRVPWAARRAEVALEVERSVIWAYLPDTNRVGLPTVVCVRALVLAVRGEEVGDEVLGRAVRMGRRGAMVDLAARDVIRMPRGRMDQRLVEDRRDQIDVEMNERRVVG